MNIMHRINQISKNEDITITYLEKKIGASKGVLSRALKNDTDIQVKWVIKIVENYPQYNTDWLLTGKGEMLKENTKPPEIDDRDAYILQLQKKLIEDQEEKIKMLSKNISKLKKAQESNPDLYKVAEPKPKLK